MVEVVVKKVEDPVQAEQIAAFQMALDLHVHDRGSQLAVIPVVCKATGKEENMIVVMKNTPSGMKVLPVAIIPIGVNLVQDYDMSQGQEKGPSLRAGSWNSDDAGEHIN